MNIGESASVSFADWLKNLILAPLIIHLQLLRQADPRKSVSRGGFGRVDSRCVTLVVERLMTLPLLLIDLVLSEL